MSEQEHRQERLEDAQKWRWVIGILVTIAIFLLTQAAFAIWWASDINSRVQQIESRQADAVRDGRIVSDLVASQDTQIAVLVTRIDEQTRQLDRALSELQDNNGLLRDYLRANGARP